jgi:uncharacterized repeat protein (TIGR03803 family)
LFMFKREKVRSIALVATVMSLMLTCCLAEAHAENFNVLYTFSYPYPNGSAPQAPLIEDTSGNLFGTASVGGNQQHGAVFELDSKHNIHALYLFCSMPNCSDGAAPMAPLIMDVNGNLYGTAYFGGSANQGVVFELMSGGSGQYTMHVLYNFCSKPSCADGTGPQMGLTYAGAASNALYDGVSPLYGATGNGGAYGQGLIFQLSPPAPGQSLWTETTMHDFCGAGGICTDGSRPQGTLLVDQSGNIYGTTAAGGANGGGEVFKLSFVKSRWKETIAYSFCALLACADGGGPAGLIMDNRGTLYGSANGGGIQFCGGGCGVVYELIPAKAHFREKVLYYFCSQTNCTDGVSPNSPLVRDPTGNLYGTTFEGGPASSWPNGGGVLFEITGTKIHILHAFCDSECTPTPDAGVIIDSSGNLFGTTVNEGGTIFEASP